MGWLDNLGAGPVMEFPHGETVTRERRKPVVDPYDPTSSVPGSWDDPLDTLPLASCFVDFSSSTAVPDATRSAISTNKSLYCPDPDVDVRAGDRVRVGTDVFYVNSRPAGYVHPFTGWRPPLEIPLDVEEG